MRACIDLHVSKLCHLALYTIVMGGTCITRRRQPAPRFMNIHLMSHAGPVFPSPTRTHTTRTGKIRSVIVHKKIMHVYNEHGENYKHECENATTVSVATSSASYNRTPCKTTVLPKRKQAQPTIYRSNRRPNKSLKNQNPKKNPRTPITIRIIFVVVGENARVMRSAEATKPDATELNVLVFYGMRTPRRFSCEKM